MATLRTYGERCAAARALDLIGERWALLIVRELLLGPKRFTDLREGMPNAKSSVLSQRLRELEDGGVLQRRKLGPPARTWVYELTPVGQQLESVMLALGRWGRQLPATPGRVHNIDALVLALKWRMEGSDAHALDGRYELRLADQRFCLDVSGPSIAARRGEAPGAVAVVEADPRALEAVVFDGESLGDAERAGGITLSGDRALARRFLRHARSATIAPAATV